MAQIIANNKTFANVVSPADGQVLVSSSPVLDSAQTWNNAGVTFTGLKLNITNTNSDAASKLLDLQVGGVSQFNVTRSGVGTLSSMFFGADTRLARTATKTLTFDDGAAGGATLAFLGSITPPAQHILGPSGQLLRIGGIEGGAGQAGSGAYLTGGRGDAGNGGAGCYLMLAGGQTGNGGTMFFGGGGTTSGGSEAYAYFNGGLAAGAGGGIIFEAGSAQGTDKDSGWISYDSGASTGTGASKHIWKASKAGSTGTDTNASVERMRLEGDLLTLKSILKYDTGIGNTHQIIGPTDNYLRIQGSGISLEPTNGGGGGLGAYLDTGAGDGADGGYFTCNAGDSADGGTAAAIYLAEGLSIASGATGGLFEAWGGNAKNGQTDKAAGGMEFRSGSSTGNAQARIVLKSCELGATGTTLNGTRTVLEIREGGDVITQAKGTETATNAATGFTHIPTCNGTPTGTPAHSVTGTAPMIIDRANHKLYAYYGGSWHDLTGA